jgi:hypothetical protein
MTTAETTITPALGSGRDGAYEWENRQAVRTVYDGPPIRSVLNGDVTGRHGDHVTIRQERDGWLSIQQCIGSAQPYECATVRLRPETFHALTALALHGQPFGFTRAEADAVRYYAEHITGLFRKDAPALASAAAKIVALLPPE